MKHTSQILKKATEAVSLGNIEKTMTIIYKTNKDYYSRHSVTIHIKAYALKMQNLEETKYTRMQNIDFTKSQIGKADNWYYKAQYQNCIISKRFDGTACPSWLRQSLEYWDARLLLSFT